MKIYLLILILSVGFNFMINGQTTNDSIKTKIMKVDGIKGLDKLTWNFCDTFSIELTGYIQH
jgi:hypothetical protein